MSQKMSISRKLVTLMGNKNVLHFDENGHYALYSHIDIKIVKIVSMKVQKVKILLLYRIYRSGKSLYFQ